MKSLNLITSIKTILQPLWRRIKDFVHGSTYDIPGRLCPRKKTPVRWSWFQIPVLTKIFPSKISVEVYKQHNYPAAEVVHY